MTLTPTAPLGISTTFAGDFDAAIDAVTAALKEQGFGVLTDIDVTATLASKIGATIEPYRIYNEEITILGSMAVLNSYGPALDLLAAGAVDADRMVTHTFDLDDFDEALALVRQGAGLKVQVGNLKNARQA